MKDPLADYFSKDAWKTELEALREIIKDCLLSEELKWKQPCYVYNKKNVLILARFKEYCAISFIKGVLLSDTEKMLHPPGENSRSVRLMKFKHVNEIIEKKSLIKAYINEAIEVEKLGLKVGAINKEETVLPSELIDQFTQNPAFQIAFEALTPGRQRGYILFFSGAKQSTTRHNRINKYVPRILKGKGINDCTCGHSKRPPSCDGSHKLFDKV